MGQKPEKIRYLSGSVTTHWDGRDRNQNPVSLAAKMQGKGFEPFR